MRSDKLATCKAELTAKYGNKKESLYDKHVTAFVVEALDDAGHAEFGR